MVGAGNSPVSLRWLARFRVTVPARAPIRRRPADRRVDRAPAERATRRNEHPGESGQGPSPTNPEKEKPHK